MGRRGGWTHQKQSPRAASSSSTAALDLLWSEINSMRERLQRVFSPLRPNNCWDLTDGPHENLRMVQWLLAGDFQQLFTDLLEANLDLTTYISVVTSNNRYVPVVEESALESREDMRHAIAAALIIRSDSQKAIACRI